MLEIIFKESQCLIKALRRAKQENGIYGKRKGNPIVTTEVKGLPLLSKYIIHAADLESLTFIIKENVNATST